MPHAPLTTRQTADMIHHSVLAFAGTPADWIRRVGVFVALIGTAAAAPDGAVQLCRAALTMLHAAWAKVRAGLARLLPCLANRVTGAAALASSGTLTVSGDAGAPLVWSDDAPPDEKIHLLHQDILRVSQDVNTLRRETRQADAELRQMIQHRADQLRTDSDALRAWLHAQERRAVRVDARGVVLIGIGVIMTGMPDGLARVPWLVLALALIATAVIVQLVKDYLCATR